MNDAISGYAGGSTENPTYGAVCSGQTGHAEIVEVSYDPNVVSFETLLKVFISLHDPTMDARHYRGGQYRSALYYTTDQQRDAADAFFRSEQKNFARPIVTEVRPAPEFWRAEDYHQRYYEKNRVNICR